MKCQKAAINSISLQDATFVTFTDQLFTYRLKRCQLFATNKHLLTISTFTLILGSKTHELISISILAYITHTNYIVNIILPNYLTSYN